MVPLKPENVFTFEAMLVHYVWVGMEIVDEEETIVNSYIHTGSQDSIQPVNLK